jgi:hypothetical protein
MFTKLSSSTKEIKNKVYEYMINQEGRNEREMRNGCIFLVGNENGREQLLVFPDLDWQMLFEELWKPLNICCIYIVLVNILCSLLRATVFKTEAVETAFFCTVYREFNNDLTVLNYLYLCI